MVLVDEAVRPKSTGVLHTSLTDLWVYTAEFRPSIKYDFNHKTISLVYPVGSEKSTSQATQVILSKYDFGFSPRTALGKKLAALRAKAIAHGMQLLSEDEVLQEVRRRRGETSDETNIY